MKQPYALAVALCLATAAQGGLAGALNSTISSSTPSPTGSPTGPDAPGVCGAGFTYCGYILRDHKNFNEKDIIKAYCAAHKSNCINGTTQTDPLQALYICLPPNAWPLENWLDSSYQEANTNRLNSAQSIPAKHDDKFELTRRPYSNPNKRLFSPQTHQTNQQEHDKRAHHMADLYQETYYRHHHQLLNHNHNPNGKIATQSSPEATYGLSAAAGTDTSTASASSSASTAPRPPAPVPDSCASSATVPGNKIQLLCSCGRQCLNPMADHIGRCDGPCSS
ncbi:hypothetical protein N658DRAFT_201409 [Parathielavia hyrcaniae]|uniref:Uncharacterized protein n=1 Tax=Parathielavia hyrcaniae TaxID=113614 RepID=A0AAN6Q7Q6_9PEZI|nr:hypothetical protein N658DRAFT_201409 [Parathielavia hyrcaniae]